MVVQSDNATEPQAICTYTIDLAEFCDKYDDMTTQRQVNKHTVSIAIV